MRQSQAGMIWRVLRKSRTAMAGGAMILLFVFGAIFAPFIAPQDPLRQNLPNSLRSPSLEHLLGTDRFGRDMLSRIIYGSRISLMISGAGVTLALLLGVSLGAIAGYYGGIIDNIIMRLMDIQLSFPMILLAILIVAILGPGIPNTIIAVAFPSVPVFARLVRGTFLSTKTLEYVEAAKALGSGDLRIIFRHLLPNSLAPIMVQGSLRAATILLTVAGLSFLGLGVQPPTPEWGALLSDGRAFLRIAPWIIISPGIAIMLVVLGLNLLGDGLRDALDPRLGTLKA